VQIPEALEVNTSLSANSTTFVSADTIEKEKNLKCREKWLNTKLSHTYTSRVQRWFDLPVGAGAPYALYPSLNILEEEKVRIKHAFSPLVDQIFHLKNYIHTQEDSIYAIAQINYHSDNSYQRGIIGWAYKQSVQGPEIFHRYFSTHCDSLLLQKDLSKLFVINECDNLLLPAKCEDKIGHEINTDVYRDPCFNTIRFVDKYNNVTITIFPIIQINC
jgi:hypothetical protein